jgi:hypothetical protein
VGGSSYSDVAVLKIRKRWWKGGDGDGEGCIGRLKPLEFDGAGGAGIEEEAAGGLVVIGHPETCGASGDEVCIERWEATLRREEDASGRIELHSRAQKGSSGGPVVTAGGRLVGMTVATGIDQDNPVIKVVPRDILQRALWEFGVDEQLGDYVDDMRYILSKKAQIVDLIAMLEKMNPATLDRLLQNSRDVEEMLSRPTLANARIERRNADDPTPIVKLALSKRSPHAASPARLDVTATCTLAPDSAFAAKMDARGGGVRLRYFGELQRSAQNYVFTVETTARAAGGFIDPESGQATLAGKEIFLSFNRPVNEMLARCREAHMAFARAENLDVGRLGLDDFAALVLIVRARFESDRTWTHQLDPIRIPLETGS